jgi:hypothetical protein
MANSTTCNSKFVQKWLTVVQLRFFVNYLVECGTKLVLQTMPFMHKFPKRQAVKKPSFLQKTYKKYPFILRFKLGIANRFLSS